MASTQSRIDISTPNATLVVSDQGDSELIIDIGEPLTGYSDPRAWWRPEKDSGTVVDFTANIVGDTIVIVIDPAAKAQMDRFGFWAVDILDPSSLRESWIEGAAELEIGVSR